MEGGPTGSTRPGRCGSGQPPLRRSRRSAPASSPGNCPANDPPFAATELGDEDLDLVPGAGPWAVQVPVVGLVEHDHGVATRTQGLDVVRRVLDVGVGLGLGFAPQEAQVPIGDPRRVQPLDGVGHDQRVTPVGDQAVGDDAQPHPCVRQAPQRLRRPGDRRHVTEHPVVLDRHAVQRQEPVAVQAPLTEVPADVGGQRRLGHVPLDGRDPAERSGVVRTHGVQIDPQDEVRHGCRPVIGGTRRAPTPSRRALHGRVPDAAAHLLRAPRSWPAPCAPRSALRLVPGRRPAARPAGRRRSSPR